MDYLIFFYSPDCSVTTAAHNVFAKIKGNPKRPPLTHIPCPDPTDPAEDIGSSDAIRITIVIHIEEIVAPYEISNIREIPLALSDYNNGFNTLHITQYRNAKGKLIISTGMPGLPESESGPEE